ncbi:MAG: FtsX-like permease family protein [Cycloclasticus sp.]|nr:FtsX-like permease family protein [Cycloclasticus sp.]
MNQLKMSIRLLWRDVRSGELTLLFLALVLAVSSSTAISLFADRLQRTMNLQAAAFLAADLVVTSPNTVPLEWLGKAQEMGLKQARTVEFSTVLIENEAMLLTSVKAVSHSYPLRGELKTRGVNGHQEIVRIHGPNSAEVWLDKRIVSTLNLALGDQVKVGERNLTFTQLITYEPDKRGDLYSLTPRVMINEDDLAATQVLQPGSRAQYFYQFSGNPSTIKLFNNWLVSRLTPSQRVMDIHEDRPEVGGALTRAQRYLGLSSIIVILIAGVAIAMSTQRYSERHLNTTAIFRCLGCQQRDILKLYLYQFLVLGLVACSAGSIIGWLTQQSLFHLLQDLLPSTTADPSFMTVILGFVTGFAILIGFALPPLLRLHKVSPLRVLRRDVVPASTSSWLVYGLVLTLLSILIWQYVQDTKLVLTLVIGGLAVIAVSSFFLHSLLGQLRKILPSLTLNTRLGLQGLTRAPSASVNQVLAFSLTLLAMLLSLTVRNDMLADWQEQLPDKAPNYFAINIFPAQVPLLKERFKQAGLSVETFHPIVRGRLIGINGQGVETLVTPDSQGERAVKRDLSLTWGEQLPSDNRTVAGEWTAVDQQTVSIESQLADSLQVTLGDVLSFSIGSEQLDVTVSHIRSVQWETMKPNFYMLFHEKVLAGFPMSYMTSFYLPEGSQPFLNGLVQEFSGLTVLEVEAMLKQFKLILTQLTAAINYLLYFALAAGFVVLFTAVQSTLDSRISEAALMRALGASRALLRRAQIIEFASLGGLSGLLAVIMSELITYGLYTFVMHLDYTVNLLLWVWVPLLSAVSVTLAGLWGVKDAINQPPMHVLVEQ